MIENHVDADERTWLQWFGERLISAAPGDADEMRKGRLFNILMWISMAIALSSFVVVILVQIGSGDTPRLVTSVPIVASVVPLSLAGLALSKRGRTRLAGNVYVVGTLLAVAVGVFMFNGPRSPIGVYFFWTAAVAGMQLHPTYALYVSAGAVGYYVLLWFLERVGIYVPPFESDLQNLVLQNLYFSAIMLISGVGLLTYLYTRSQATALARLRQTMHELEDSRRTLEHRVEERTALLSRRAREFQAIAELARATVGVRDVDVLLSEAVQQITQRFGFHHAGIFLVDDAGEWAILKAASSEGGRRMLQRGHRLRVGEQGIVGHVARTGRARIAQAVGRELVYFNNPDLPDTRAEMALPLEVRGRLIGVLDIQSVEEEPFTEDDVAILGVLADQLALAIDNARLLTDIWKTLDRLSRYRMEETLQSWQKATQRRAERMGYLYDQTSVRPLSLDESREILAVDESPREVAVRDLPDGRFVLVAPVLLHDRTIGALSFEARRPWEPDEVSLVETAAQQMGLALENARLLEETRQQAEREQGISQMMARFARFMDTSALLQMAVRELGQLPRVREASVHIGVPDAARAPSGDES